VAGLVGAFAEFERTMIRERRHASIGASRPPPGLLVADPALPGDGRHLYSL
jgi:hypothetical protein